MGDWKRFSRLVVLGLVAAAQDLAGASAALGQQLSPEPIFALNTPYHAGYVLHLAITPDERQVVTAGFDKTIRVWDVATGELLRRFYLPLRDGGDGRITALSLSPDGERIAAGRRAVRLRQGKGGDHSLAGGRPDPSCPERFPSQPQHGELVEGRPPSGGGHGRPRGCRAASMCSKLQPGTRYSTTGRSWAGWTPSNSGETGRLSRSPTTAPSTARRFSIVRRARRSSGWRRGPSAYEARCAQHGRRTRPTSTWVVTAMSVATTWRHRHGPKAAASRRRRRASPR